MNGISKLFLVVVGLSPALALVLYFVLQNQEKLNVKQDAQLKEMNKDFAEFESDFSAAFTGDNKHFVEKKKVLDKEALLAKAEQKKAEERYKKAQSKTESQLDELEKELDKQSF